MNSLARFDSTQLVIVIIIQNIGIQPEIEANNSGSFLQVHTWIFSEAASFSQIARRGRVILQNLVHLKYLINPDAKIRETTIWISDSFKYSEGLNTEHVLVSNGEKLFWCWIVLILNGIPKLNSLTISNQNK